MNDSPKKYSLISLDASTPESNALPRETVNENGVSTTHLVVDGEETVVVSSKPAQTGVEQANAVDAAKETAKEAELVAQAAQAAELTHASKAAALSDAALKTQPSGESNKAAEVKKRQPSASLQDEDEEIPFKRMQTTIIICLVAVMAIFFIYFNFFRH